jgi:hypothetical protein
MPRSAAFIFSNGEKFRLKLLKERLWSHDFRAVIGSTPRLLSADDNFSFQAHFLARA